MELLKVTKVAKSITEQNQHTIAGVYVDDRGQVRLVVRIFKDIESSESDKNGIFARYVFIIPETLESYRTYDYDYEGAVKFIRKYGWVRSSEAELVV